MFINPQKGNRFIAMLDVLGFSDLVKNQKSLDDLISLYNHAFEHIHDTYVKEVQGKPEFIYVSAFSFSDTILFWSEIFSEEDLDSTGEFRSRSIDKFMDFIGIISNIMLEFSFQKLPYRLGIAFGECYIFYAGSSLGGPNPSTAFLGKPIVDAYQTSECLNYIGVAFHPSCKRFFYFNEIADVLDKGDAPLGEVIFSYDDLPVTDKFVKFRIEDKLKFTINYAYQHEDGSSELVLRNDLQDYIQFLTEKAEQFRIDEKPDIAIKYENTIKFLEHVPFT